MPTRQQQHGKNVRVWVYPIKAGTLLTKNPKYNGEPMANAAVCPSCRHMQTHWHVAGGADACWACDAPKPFMYMDELARELDPEDQIIALTRKRNPAWAA